MVARWALAALVVGALVLAAGCNDSSPESGNDTTGDVWGDIAGSWVTVEELGVISGPMPMRVSGYDPNLQWKLRKEAEQCE